MAEDTEGSGAGVLAADEGLVHRTGRPELVEPESSLLVEPGRLCALGRDAPSLQKGAFEPVKGHQRL